MPSIATMTEPLPESRSSTPSPVGATLSGYSSPSGVRRRRRSAQPTHTFHLNIGRVEVPRSLPQVRSLGIQTDESALGDQAQKDKKWHRKALKWGKKWVLPVLRAGVNVLGFVMGRVGFGFRLN